MSEMIADSETVHIYLQSYELSKPYLKRALDSIKNQTYTNWICHIFDNGSGDEVKGIISQYAQADSRFRPLFVKESNTIVFLGIPMMVEESNGSGYFMMVDADDELVPLAMERLVGFSKQYSLDMTVAGAYFVDSVSGKLLGSRCASRNIVVEGRDFEAIFDETYQLMRTHWIKLYKMEVIKRINLSKTYNIGFGGDTFFVRESILNSYKIGIMTDILYRYYQINYTGKSYYKDVSRISAPEAIFKRDIDFLSRKCGALSEKNLMKLLVVYVTELREVISLISQELYGQDIIGLMHSVICSDVFKLAVTKVKSDLYLNIAQWLISQHFWENENDFAKAAEILSAISLVPNEVPGCPEEMQLLLFIKVHRVWDNMASIGEVESLIKKKAEHIGILSKCPIRCLCDCEDMVSFIVHEEYKRAQEWIIEAICNEMEFSTVLWKRYLLQIGVDLAALNEDIDKFILLKRMQIELLSVENPGLAEREKAEWSELLFCGE